MARWYTWTEGRCCRSRRFSMIGRRLPDSAWRIINRKKGSCSVKEHGFSRADHGEFGWRPGWSTPSGVHGQLFRRAVTDCVRATKFSGQ